MFYHNLIIFLVYSAEAIMFDTVMLELTCGAGNVG